MTFTQHYDSPLGGILLAADEIGLTGLWFDGEKYFADNLPIEHTELETPILAEAKQWLDLYFTGNEPNFMPPLHPIGSDFRKQYGRSFHRYLTARPRPTVKYPGSLPKNRDLPGCPRRRSAVQSGITKYPLLFRVTVWSVQMEA